MRADLDALDLPTVGRDGPRWFAVTSDEARRALAHFVELRLPASIRRLPDLDAVREQESAREVF